jgi:hypothetical protein
MVESLGKSYGHQGDIQRMEKHERLPFIFTCSSSEVCVWRISKPKVYLCRLFLLRIFFLCLLLSGVALIFFLFLVWTLLID